MTQVSALGSSTTSYTSCVITVSHTTKATAQTTMQGSTSLQAQWHVHRLRFHHAQCASSSVQVQTLKEPEPDLTSSSIASRLTKYPEPDLTGPRKHYACPPKLHEADTWAMSTLGAGFIPRFHTAAGTCIRGSKSQ